MRAQGASVPNFSGLRLLIVEDEFAMARVLTSTLKALGCTIVGPAPRFEEAFELARSEIFDGAILDVNLAGSSVFPIADLLDEQGVPYVFATGYDEDVIPENYRDRPRLGKPFNMQELVSLAESMFHSKTQNLS